MQFVRGEQDQSRAVGPWTGQQGDEALAVAVLRRAQQFALEGALRRVLATSRFTGRPVTLELAREALKDLLAAQERLVTIENIQKTVAEYYKIRVADLLSKRRSRSIARPRNRMRLRSVRTGQESWIIRSGGRRALVMEP